MPDFVQRGLHVWHCVPHEVLFIAGSYNVTVTDSKGCTANASATVTQPDDMVITPTITQNVCNGGKTGEIALSVTGGTGTKTYLWNDGATTQNRTLLYAGTYAVTVTDANGCKKVLSGISVTEPTAISVSASASTILCNGSSSTITVTASGGTGTLTYSLNGGTYQAGNTFSVSASPSAYNITVKDNNNCTRTTSVTVTQPAPLVLSVVVGKETCAGFNNGSITLTATGGTPNYTYDWTDVPGAINTKDRSGLNAGSYTVIVTDANGCTATTAAVVTVANPNPSTPGMITN